MNILVSFADSTTKVYERDDIKSLNIKLECDPTIATIPVCEFDTEIIDTEKSESDFKTAYATVRDDARVSGGTLYNLTTKYVIVEAKKTSENVYYFKAQSILSTLDNYELLSRYYSSTRADIIIDDIFEDCGYIEFFPYEIQPASQYLNNTFSGYLPAQTARERLLTVMQATCSIVQQWSYDLYENYANAELHLCDAVDYSTSAGAGYYRNIYLGEIYAKPIIKRVDNADSVKYNTYDSWRSSKPSNPDDYEHFVKDVEYDLDTGQPYYNYYYAQKYEEILGKRNALSFHAGAHSV